MKPNQRNAAQAALPLIAADGRLRVTDPTVRKTITVLAELGMLRTRPVDRSPKLRPAIGSTRRLQVLSHEGWSQTALSEALGVSLDTVKLHRRGNQRSIRIELAQAIRELYESEAEPLELDSRSQTHAAKTGWPARWQWRNLNLDDPSVHPHPPLV